MDWDYVWLSTDHFPSRLNMAPRMLVLSAVIAERAAGSRFSLTIRHAVMGQHRCDSTTSGCPMKDTSSRI